MTDDGPTWPRSTAALDELAARRQQREPGPTVSPAAARLIGTAIGNLRELLADATAAAPMPPEIVDLGAGRGSFALVVTFDIADLNREAARVDRDRPAVEALTREAAQVADAERAVLEAARAWHLSRGDAKERQAQIGKLTKAAERLAIAEGLFTVEERLVLPIVPVEPPWATTESIARDLGRPVGDVRSVLDGLRDRGAVMGVAGSWRRAP